MKVNKLTCNANRLNDTRSVGRLRGSVISPLKVLALALALPSAAHSQDLVINGGFETNTGNGQLGLNTTATPWATSQGYSFIYNTANGTTSGTSADNGGASNGSNMVEMWGPGKGENNGLTLSPTGGAFLAVDSFYPSGTTPVTQLITGLTINQKYNLSFDWAAAQQYLYDGATFGRWDVTFGTEQHSTSSVSIASHGFSGWMHENMQFTATQTSQTLSFLAVGGPNGLPPFVFLDSVSMPVPELSTAPLLFIGVTSFGIFRRRRRSASKSTRN